jgi:hypothetical protein
VEKGLYLWPQNTKTFQQMSPAKEACTGRVHNFLSSMTILGKRKEKLQRKQIYIYIYIKGVVAAGR